MLLKTVKTMPGPEIADLHKAAVLDNKHQKTVILADMKATTVLILKLSKFDESETNNNFNHVSNDNGERLINYCKTHKLCISNTFFKHKAIHRYSWYSGTGLRNVIDYILADRHLQNYMLDCRIRRGYDFSSDHKLLVATLKTPCNRAARFKHRKTPPRITKMLDLTALLIPKIKTVFSHQVSTKFEKY